MPQPDEPSWRLIVLEGRNGVPFELVFDAPQLGSSGCGTPAPEAVLGRFAGGGRWQGEDLVYVYGSVLPPVETVTVSYQNGLTVELRPVAADGMQHRFYAHVSGGTGAVNVSAFDGAGRLIA